MAEANKSLMVATVKAALADLVTDVGIDYCTEHHGIREADENACDYLDREASGRACVLVPLSHFGSYEELSDGRD